MNSRPFPHLRIAGLMRGNTLLSDLWRHAQRQLARVPGCLSTGFGVSDLQVLRSWRPDGIIAHIHRRDLLDPLLSLNVPVVNTSGIFEDLPVPSVGPDNEAAGGLAAEYLLEKRYRRFVYVGTLRHGYSRRRLQGFRRRLRRAGKRVIVHDRMLPASHRIAREADTEMLGPLADWLRSLPTGAGIFTADERVAYSMLEIMRVMKIDPLPRFGIIAGHDRNVPSNPTLSAVIMPEEQWGREAARLLVRLVRGEPPPAKPILLPPLGIAERESTIGGASGDQYVRAALLFIRHHADRDIGVEDVVAAVALGRRALERRFRQDVGRTILQEIHRAHLEHARLLLAETSYNLQRVALESGLTDANQLVRLFKKHLGTTPSVWRRQHSR